MLPVISESRQPPIRHLDVMHRSEFEFRLRHGALAPLVKELFSAASHRIRPSVHEASSKPLRYTRAVLNRSTGSYHLIQSPVLHRLRESTCNERGDILQRIRE